MKSLTYPIHCLLPDLLPTPDLLGTPDLLPTLNLVTENFEILTQKFRRRAIYSKLF